MPRKIQRFDSFNPAPQLATSAHGSNTRTVENLTAVQIKATAQVYTSTVNAVAATVKSLADCGKAYFSYLGECEKTLQIGLMSAAAIAEAQEHTRQIEIQAQVLLGELADRKDARDAKMEVIRTILTEHRELQAVFDHQNTALLANLSPDQRNQLMRFREELRCRLRDLQVTVVSLTSLL